MENIGQRGVRRKQEGVVISDAMDKTIVVRVQRRFRHPVYGKEIKQAKKLYAHDEKGEAKKGDVVQIVESRPMSKLKRWRLVEILKKGTDRVMESANDRTEN